MSSVQGKSLTTQDSDTFADLISNASVSSTKASIPSTSHILQGQYIALENLSHTHIPGLWHNFGLSSGDRSIFHWLPLASPTSEDELWKLFEDVRRDHGMIIYAIVGTAENSTSHVACQSEHREALGTIGYLDINIQQRTLETGAVLFSAKLQRSAAATEAHYLLLQNVCEPPDGSLPYRRIAWKNNSLNSASRRAAERIGYVYEGSWRKHMISKGESRDSDWLSIIDEEWPVVKSALERWLMVSNFDHNGKQTLRLEEIRAEVMKDSV